MKTIKFLFPMALGAALTMAFAFTSEEHPVISNTMISEDVDVVYSNCQENFCTLSERELQLYASNYRDDIWSENSPYFEVHEYDLNKGVLVDPGRLAKPSVEDSRIFDARFLDISVEAMEEYICALKTYQPEVHTLRFYYIKYGANITADNTIPEGFQNKHSLAVVPALKISGDYSEFYTDQQGNSLILGVGEDCDVSGVMNHGHICPPWNDCGDLTHTLINVIDSPHIRP